jgi:hypothetical protein
MSEAPITQEERWYELYLHWQQTGELHQDLFFPVWLHTEYPDRPSILSAAEAAPVRQAFEEIYDAVEEFERAAWYGGLQQVVRDCPQRGMRGKARALTFRTFVCAGRCMLTLEAESGANVTLITADDEAPYQRRSAGSPKMGPMGLQSVHASRDQAVAMIRESGRYWREFCLKADEHVAIA